MGFSNSLFKKQALMLESYGVVLCYLCSLESLSLYFIEKERFIEIEGRNKTFLSTNFFMK